MLEGDAAQADAADQPLVAGLDHRGELAVEQFAVDLARGAGIAVGAHHAQVHRREPVGAEGFQVLLDGGPQFGGLLCRQPGAGLVPAGTDLADEREALRIRMQGLADQLVGHVGAIELRGVDVVDAELHRASQHGERLVAVAGGPKTPGPGSCMAPNPIRWTWYWPSACVVM